MTASTTPFDVVRNCSKKLSQARRLLRSHISDLNESDGVKHLARTSLGGEAGDPKVADAVSVALAFVGVSTAVARSVVECFDELDTGCTIVLRDTVDTEETIFTLLNTATEASLAKAGDSSGLA